MADGSTIIAITTIILSFVVQTWCQDCLPCSCCKLGTACSGTKDGIDNYCLGGCMDGYMSSQCQKPCVNKLCQRCSKSGTCDTCYDNYYGEQCTSKCPSTCKTCTSSNSCTSCKDGYHNGSETTCLYPCKTLCLSCSNSTSCTACKVRSGVGYYGSDCSIQCSNKCKAFLCDINGNCLQCDDPNFKGDNCDRCVDGKYGNQCKKNCPVNCISCESDTHCTSCTDEFTGITCSTRTECPDNCYNSSFCLSTGKCESCKDGLYGEYCNMTCSRNCRYGYCNQDGSCKAGCKDGFNGSMCEIKICPPNCTCNTSNNCIGCNSNYFGPSCSLTCSSCKVNVCPVDRLNAVKCDECADGKYGNLCNESCPKNCLNDSCNQDGSCKSGCEDRFNGSRCEQRICPPNCTCNTSNNCIGCKSNYFGPSCSLSCSSCKDIICPVDRINAVKCDECADGKYGNLCNERCSDNCLNNRCDQDSGACTCENEYKFQNGTCVRSICPANCSTCTSSDNCTSCVDEYYHGDTCEHECSNCRSGTTCGKSDGYCQDECADGFSGYYCSTPCNDGCDTCTRSQTNECRACRTGRHGYDGSYYTCSNTCNYTCANNSCDALNGQCDQGCVDGYFGPFCNISCASNCKSCHHDNGLCDLCAYDYWGEYCLNNCSENCTHINESLSSCDIASGKCKYGCQHGTHGSLCSIECDQKCIASESGVRECRHTDGQCTQGCITGYKQGNTGCIDVLTFSEASVGARTSGAVIGGAVGGVVALLATALVIGAFILIRRSRRRKDSTDNPKTGGYEADLVISKEENGAVFQNATASTSIYHVINDTTENVKPENGFENNPTASKDENKEDRSPDCQDTIVITKASTGQSKTKKLRNSAGRSEQLENSVKGQTPIKDASNDITHNKDTGDVYYNMNEVAVKDLGLFVATKDKAYFLEEFKKLPEGLVKPHQDAMRPENRPRNRYQGIYPYDDTRVKLTGGDTDFINASFVDGYRQENAYIASQGPTEKTMQDYSVFWRMIWQQKVGKIVMLTNLVEDGKPKCDQYWPDHGTTKQYGEIHVTCLTEDMYADFLMLTFSVKMDKEDRAVQHLHFTSWPDKGVPDDVTSLVDFRHRVLQTKSPLDGPTLVHCSAGVGRTGTYIAMDVLTREGEAEGSVDIHGCVNTLRHRRTRMVQTADQYAFLHHAIVHTLTLDSTPVTTEGFTAYLSDSENEQRQIKQFKQLEDITERSEHERLASERNAALTNSNRKGTDIPGNLYRPRLHLGKEPGQDYINAMYVNSYKQRKKFVLAMTPLDETVADFLCLTIQETAACIVDMENDSSLYIPDVGTQAKFGSYTVDNLREKSTSYSVNRVLRISYNGRGGPKEHTVSHYEYTGWPDNAEVPESAKNFLHLVKEVETKSASGSVIAHCKTGGGRCGMFAAVWTILEKTGIEHEVSIFNTVRQLRARRPNALCTSEQYSFCYECVREYLQTFDIYSNFS
ncbi:multiple epidermal growth factor-like domains protein 10 isoform X2 [Mya arenaria]|nr:multiple epidermal growth factor-like domains protein 10 isoform X2 [Mya arenaria]XP_052762509.1 multiple epidermal growth factor-like domains protein 10 isoform X2 [Mya arenaria]XP_052762510.1 multiple epidermal growth factor-like domains protein 10 isoform X2 [Mya arenaria]XP_052762511.1 multiple epidermal growth factor-like domains protein 10 isoform X2 [Mya arenaria]